MKRLLCFLVFVSITPLAHADTCGAAPLQLQILGSSGASLAEGRAASGVLLWLNGKARALVDVGPGAVLRFSQTDAQAADLDVTLFTQLRSERSADLPALVQLMTSAARTRVLPIYGPADSRWMPSTVSFVRALFDPTRGAWRHLGDPLNPLVRNSFRLEPRDVRVAPSRLGRANEKPGALKVFAGERLHASALPVLVGTLPTLAWSLEAAEKRVVISAETNDANTLAALAKNADVLVVPLSRARGAALAAMAQAAGVKQLVFAPRERLSAEQTEQTMATIQRLFTQSVVLANDLDCVTP